MKVAIMANFSSGACNYCNCQKSLRWMMMMMMMVFFFVGTTTVVVNGDHIFLEWRVANDTNIKPASVDQPVITINGMFPGPLINSTTNDIVHVNVFNDLDEPLLFTWNGIQQRLDSWQDGVSGTNCPIQPGKNWTYVFAMKDQIGSFFYFPTTNFQKAAGGFGPIRVNNRIVIAVPFPEPRDEFDLLIGDWYNQSYKDVRSQLNISRLNNSVEHPLPTWMLMNGKGPYGNPLAQTHESFNVSQGGTYRFRISNVGTTWSFNFRIQNHTMLLVETEGSYTIQTKLDSLDVHVGQSYSVLVTMDQAAADYYIVASPKVQVETNQSTLIGIGVLHYNNSTTPASGPLPDGPDPIDMNFSINQARSIKWNLTAGAARPNPQGSFNVANVTVNRTFVFHGGHAIDIDGVSRYAVNNVSYLTPATPLKLADYALNGSGVYVLDKFPVQHVLHNAVKDTFVTNGIHKEYLEIVFVNDHDSIDTWHLDGFGCFVVGFGIGDWSPDLRLAYNLNDPVVRSTFQVYPKGWTAVYSYMDNPGMWNLRSQTLKHWYLGQELYIRVYDPDPNPAKEMPPPQNLLYCGVVVQPPPVPPPTASPAPAPHHSLPPSPSPHNPSPSPQTSSAASLCIEWLLMAVGLLMVLEI